MTKVERTRESVKSKLLDFLDSVVDSPDESTKDRILAAKTMGIEFGLFIEQKNVKIDVNTVVHHLSNQQLMALAGESNEPARTEPDIDVEVDANYRVGDPDNHHDNGAGSPVGKGE